MKSKLLFTILGLLLALCSNYSKAQEYEYVPMPTQNAIWSEIYYPGYENGEPSLERFALNGEDTTINNLVYKKLYLFYDTVFNVNNATYFGGIREDSMKKVYFTRDSILHEAKPPFGWYDYKEIMLFDFSLNIGDTIKNVPDYDYMFLVVKDIDTIKIGNTLRKKIYFEDFFWFNWIEGIGNTMGLLFVSGDLPFNGMGGNLICFKQDDEILYLKGNECMPLISGIQHYNQEIIELEIYPNPASQKINIIFPDNETGRLGVYNEIGKIVYKTDVFNIKDLSINMPCLNTGLYYIVFIGKNNKIYSSKLIIN